MNRTSNPGEAPLSRRAAVQRISAGIMLTLGRWPGALRAQDVRPPVGQFRFIVVNDTHDVSYASTTVVTNRCCALKRTNHDGTPERGFVDCDPKDGRLSRRFVEIT